MTIEKYSLELNIGVLDHLPPQRKLGLDEVAELFRCRGEAFEADILEPGLHGRTVDDRAQGAIELRDNLRRRACRRDQARPRIEVEARNAGLIHRRQIREQLTTLDARYRERPQRTGTDMR